MAAQIRESEVLKVAAMLIELAKLDDTTLPEGLEPDEITLLSRHRRQKLTLKLRNKGIEVKPDPEPDTVVTAGVDSQEPAP